MSQEELVITMLTASCLYLVFLGIYWETRCRRAEQRLLRKKEDNT